MTDLPHMVRILPAALDVVDALCEEARALETGGVLVGRYIDNISVEVTEALPPPPDSVATTRTFLRGVEGLREALTERWSREQRTHYVGEWHYHPSDEIDPSQEDVSMMHSISRDASYRCRCPIMVIFGQRPGPTQTGRVRPPRPWRTWITPDGELLEVY